MMNCSCWFCQMAGASSALVDVDQAGVQTNTALAMLPTENLISNELANFAKKVVKNDNVMDIYLQTTPGTVRVGGGSFGAQDINALAMAADLQQFIKDTFTRLDPLIDLDFRFITTKTNSDLDFYVDSDIEVGGSGTTLGIALSNSSSSRNWWELALNGPALQNQADYLRYATIHEFGHAMGLEHPFDNGDGDYYGSTNSGASAYPEDSVMSYRSPLGGSWPTWYSNNDIKALQEIWGVEKTTPVNSIPKVEPAPAPIPTPTPAPIPATVPIFRLLNRENGKHLYTSSSTERDTLSGLYFNYEGIAYNAPINSNQPLYRFYKPSSGHHFYTASNAEKDQLVANNSLGYMYEGIAYNVYSAESAPSGSIPVYRFYEPFGGRHFYTSSGQERAEIISKLLHWQFEGIAFFV